MKFAKYYDVTTIMHEEYKKAGYSNIYICQDVTDYHIIRVLPNHNEDFEYEEGKFLVEMENISIWEVLESYDEDSTGLNKNDIHDMLSVFSDENIFKHVMMIDCEEHGMENYDIEEVESLEEAEKIVDGGFGIIRFNTGDIEYID